MIAELKSDVAGSGFAEVLVRSDNELAVLALKESTATALKLVGVTVKTEDSALYDSQSTGLAESAVKNVKEVVRPNVACFFTCFGREFPGGGPVWPQIAAMVNRCRRDQDGKTAYELRKSANSREQHPFFLSEKILFMIPGVTKGVERVEPRCEDEVFLGVSDRSEALRRTERGMHKVRTLRRREATKRVDLKFMRSQAKTGICIVQ